MHSRLLDDRKVISRARAACADIDKIVNSGNVYTGLGYHRDPVQTLVLRNGSKNDGIIMPLFEAAAIEAEKRSAGAGEILLKIVSTHLMNDMKNMEIGAISDDEWQDILLKIKSSSIPTRKSNLLDILPIDTRFSNIVKNVFQNLYAGDRVLVKKSAISSTQITRKNGYIFDGLNINRRFNSKGMWTKKNCRLILIDGVIEQISEIHRFLEELSKSKQPAVIACLDALPDVCETLAKNYEMGNLDVVLVKIPVDEYHINTLVDLGEIIQNHPISAKLGETVAQGCLRHTSVVDRISIFGQKMIIEDKKHTQSVSKHVLGLRQRIDQNRDLSTILEPRIQSLCGSAIQVDIGIEDLKADPNIIEKLDRFFRSLPRIMNFGLIDKKDLDSFSKDKVCLLFGETDVAPAETITRSIEIFLSIRKTIRSTGAAIESI
jgi:hypothetical protein